MAGVFQFSSQETSAKQMAGRNEAENEVSGNKRPRAEGDRIAAAPSGVSFKSKLMNSSNLDSWVGFGAGREKLKINPGDFQFEEGPNGTELLMSFDIKAQLLTLFLRVVVWSVTEGRGQRSGVGKCGCGTDFV
ncbi:hypothetical protein ACOSQ4_007909 [Xanthoceras sorbifolium]